MSETTKKVWEFIRARGARGATRPEIAQGIGHFEYEVRAQLISLQRSKLIRQTCRCRPEYVAGPMCRVYEANPGRPDLNEGTQ